LVSTRTRCGSLSAPPDSLAAIKRPTFKGRGRDGKGKEGKRGDRKGGEKVKGRE